MRSRKLHRLLLLSLAVNLGVLGYVGWNRYRDRQWRTKIDREYIRASGLTPAQYRLVRDKLDEQYRQMDVVHRPYRTALRELGELGELTAPDSVRVAAVLERIRQSRRYWRKWLFESSVWIDQLWRRDIRAKMAEKGIAELETEIARRESLLAGKRGVR
jgi:hypothetical protein